MEYAEQVSCHDRNEVVYVANEMAVLDVPDSGLEAAIATS
jgi:hypothetical protein